jgi:hypothetical protein
MNETTNIPAILRGKPQGTKLHDLVRGIDVFLNNVVDGCDKVCCTFDKSGLQKLHYSSKGTLVSFEDGMVILVPSETMQDWNKFAWKKGDVLVSNDGKREVLFKSWVNDSYTKFAGLHCLIINDNEEFEYDNGTTVFNTNDFEGIEAEDAAQTYINTIEEKLGGKLNKETLEVEKQSEFKDGDIVALVVRKCTHIAIFQSRQEAYIGFHAVLCQNDELLLEEPFREDVGDIELRLATDSEKRQLFDAIEKDGKAWDAEKKQVVRLQASGKLYYFEMENELAYIAKLKKAKGGKYTFESNVSWCPRNSTNGYDYEEGSFIVSDKDCYGFREANADECKIFEKFIVEHAMKSFKFKALDYVLAKNITCYESNAWNIFQYAYQNKDGAHIMVGGAAFLQCIPYVGNEDLLGTTKLYSTKK